MNDRRWKSLVREGRSLVLTGAEGRLHLGRIAQEIEPNGSQGRRNDLGTAVPKLVEYAEQIDVEVETLRQYRDVLLKWGGDPDDCPKTSWTVLRELAAFDDPHEAYRTVLRDHGAVNTVAVRIYRGVPGWNHQAATPVESKARQVRQLLSDPAVAKEVVRDPETRQAVNRATSQVRDEGLIRNRPGFERARRDIEIEQAAFFRSIASTGAEMFLAELRGAARSLALLVEHDVPVPGDVMNEAQRAADDIFTHLSVLSLRSGLEAWGVRTDG